MLHPSERPEGLNLAGDLGGKPIGSYPCRAEALVGRCLVGDVRAPSLERAKGADPLGRADGESEAAAAAASATLAALTAAAAARAASSAACAALSYR